MMVGREKWTLEAFFKELGSMLIGRRKRRGLVSWEGRNEGREGLRGKERVRKKGGSDFWKRKGLRNPGKEDQREERGKFLREILRRVRFRLEILDFLKRSRVILHSKELNINQSSLRVKLGASKGIYNK